MHHVRNYSHTIDSSFSQKKTPFPMTTHLKKRRRHQLNLNTVYIQVTPPESVNNLFFNNNSFSESANSLNLNNNLFSNNNSFLNSDSFPESANNLLLNNNPFSHINSFDSFMLKGQ